MALKIAQCRCPQSVQYNSSKPATTTLCSPGTMIACIAAAVAPLVPKIHSACAKRSPAKVFLTVDRGLWAHGLQMQLADKYTMQCGQHHILSISTTHILCNPRSSSLQLNQIMAQIVHIPFDILRIIIVRLISPSVESLDSWAECIRILGVSHLWRTIGEPLLYSNIVINLDALSIVRRTSHSNTSLVVSNRFENHVRAAVIHISSDLDRADAIVAFLFMPNSLATNLNIPSTMGRFWRMTGTTPVLFAGACMEPLLLAMPNLRYVFVESRFMTNPWIKFMSAFFHYSVARQVSSRIGVSRFTEIDFIASFSHENIAALDSNAAMTRMILAPSSREQNSASTSRRRFVPSGDRVLFCAEYIRRLRILDMPQSALGLDASIGALRDRNPCPLRENFMRNMWYNIRYRSYLYVPNIWFENSTNGVIRYELFAFNRNANDHMLQISASMPDEGSEPVQYPDFISDHASSGSDPDDGYFSL